MDTVTIAALMIVGGGILAWYLWNQTEGEYPLVYWLGWGVAMGGVLVLAGALHPLTTRYFMWSTLLGLVLAAAFLAGTVEDEFLPPAWIGVGILLTNALLFGLGLVLPLPLVGILLAVLAVVLLFLGWWLRRDDRFGYDAATSAAVIFAVVAVLAGTNIIKTPLDYLNRVDIPLRNRALGAAQQRSAAFVEAREQAQNYRAQLANDFETDAAYLDMVDQHIAAAEGEYARVPDDLATLGDTEPPAQRFDAALQERMRDQTDRADDVALQAQRGITELGGVQELYEQFATEWTKEYLWFEVDGYWTSENDENPSYNVCYYGERVSTRTGTGADVDEQIVSDELDRTGKEGLFASDQRDVDWKYFTLDDYTDLVNAGLVPAASAELYSDEGVGTYLCGDSPQTGSYGALGEPPVVIEKEFGSLVREVGDEGASFVGNYRYGTWCMVAADGASTAIPEDQEPPADAQWCWYQKPNDSTNYYWERQGSSGSFIWIRSHRRCVYCTPQASWSGGDLVPDSTLARTNGTDGSTTRGPLDQGGGPGTGK